MVESDDHVDVVRYMCDLPRDRGGGSPRGNLGVHRTTLTNMVRYLCELPPDRGVSPSAQSNHAIRTAAQSGHVDVVRYLCELSLDRGVNPSTQGNNAIRAAAQNGHVDVVRYLCELPLDRGVNPSAQGNDAIRAAAGHGHVDVVRYLCELPPDRGVDPQTCSISIKPDLFSWPWSYQSAVIRYLSCLPVWQSSSGAVSLRYVHGVATIPKQACWSLVNWYDSITVRKAARLPVLALRALVGGIRASVGLVHSRAVAPGRGCVARRVSSQLGECSWSAWAEAGGCHRSLPSQPCTRSTDLDPRVMK